MARAQILFDVDLEVRRGEVVALMGRNGAGKSTTLKARDGHAAPSAAARCVHGPRHLASEPHDVARLGLGFVPEDRRVFTDLTVMENLEVGRQPPRRWSDGTDAPLCVGILMLEARFPRIPGDMGNGLTWPFPVLYKVVPGASPDRVVRDRAEGLLDAFLDAAAELVRLGADGITTNCGFLSLYQRELAAHVGVPVATSSLMQAPLIERDAAARKAGRHPDLSAPRP